MEYTVKQLNFFRVCYIVFNIVPQGLLEIFKQEWDALFLASPHGHWDDTPASYASFLSLETPRNRNFNRRLLGLMTSGNRTKWDCTCLFYAILYSSSVGPMLQAGVKKSVDNLRKIRNEVAHSTVGNMNDVDFQTVVHKIKAAFNSLKLSTTEIEEVQNQTSFPTKELDKIEEELKNIKKELKNVEKELEDEKKRNAEPISFCVLPPKPSHDTIKREKEAAQIYDDMQRLSSEKKQETTVVYLSGNPGSGKSVLAQEIGEKFYDCEDSTATLKFVMTLDASNLESLLQSYINFVGKLNCCPDSITSIATSKDLSKEDQIHQIRALADKQITKFSSWLMIVDNVVNLKSFSKYWPQTGEKTSGKGRILVTTQDTPSIGVSTYCHHVSLSSGMAEQDAMELLSKVSDYKDTKNDMMLKVCKELDFQPLALSSAAVYVQSIRTINKQYTWDQCLQDLQKEREKLETIYKRTSLAYDTTMTAAVNLAIERESQQDEIMLHTFCFLSSIAQDPIPMIYVIEYVQTCMSDQDKNLIASRICSSSLVLSSVEKSKDISIHQVVYHCLQANRVIIESNINMFTGISSFSPLKIFTNDENVESFTTTRPLVNHILKIAQKLTIYVEDTQGENVIDGSVINILLNFSSISCVLYIFEASKNFSLVLLSIQLTEENSCKTLLSNVKQIFNALQHNDHTKYISDINNKVNNPSVGNTLVNLGIAYKNLGRYEESIKYYEKALAIKTAAYNDNHPSVGIILGNLGNAYNDLGRYEESIKYYEKALAINTAAYGENHPSVGDTLNNLGNAYQKLGRYEESIKYYEKALAIKTAAYGENHPSVGDTLNNLGAAYNDLGRYEESIKYYEKALAIKTAACGENHPSVGDILNNLGNAYRKLGRYEESIKYHEKALAIKTAAYGENHPSVGSTLNNLGIAYQILGRYEESIKYCEKALAINTAACGENHRSVGDILNNLGIAYQILGRYEESIKYYEKGLAIKTAACGENHPSVGDTLNNLGNAYQKLGRYEESIKYYEKALAIKTAARGENHPSVGGTLNNLGNAYCNLG